MSSLSIFFNRTACPALQGMRGSKMENLKTKAFGKLASLIPEGIKARLRPIKERIAEVMKK